MQEQLENLLKTINANEEKMKLLQDLLQKIQDNSLQEAIEKISNITTIYDEVTQKEEKIKSILQEIETQQEQINNIHQTIFNKEDGSSSQALEDIQRAQDYAQKLQKGYQKFYDTQDSQGNVTQGIITKLDKACTQIQENEQKINELDKFYIKVFEGEKNETGDTIKKSLRDTLDEHTKKLNDLHNSKENKLNTLISEKEEKLAQLYANKEQEINNLLPGATTAGLAKAYQEEKERIGKSIVWWNWIFAISALVFIGSFGAYFYFSLQESFTYTSFLRSLPFWIFSGFFTYYSTKQIAKYMRLQSEYTHKETLNATYIGYKKQIDKAENNKELNQKLLEIMLDSAKLNPSNTLEKHKGELASLTMIEKMLDFLPLDSLTRLKEVIERKLSAKNSD